MKVDRIKKQVTPEDAYEVIDIWYAPTTLDYRAGGTMCANFAAQIYANLDYDEAKEWSLVFPNTGYSTMFECLSDAYDAACDYSMAHGEVEDEFDDRPARDASSPVLRVAEAFRANPAAFVVDVYENDDNMLQVTLTNTHNDQFSFTILDDYHIFTAFSDWKLDRDEAEHQAALRDAADVFLSKL